MKFNKYLFIVAIFGAALFVSCTPESVEDGDQQINPHEVKEVPAAG